jgi:hypothetical protein
MWTIEESRSSACLTDGFVYVEGETQDYRASIQFIIHSIDPVDPTPEQMRDLLPSTKRDVRRCSPGPANCWARSSTRR